MGIFSNFFGKKDATEENLASAVYQKRSYVNWVVAGLVNSGEVMAIVFFESTKAQLLPLCANEEMKNRIVLYNSTTSNSDIQSVKDFLGIPGRRIVFAERYPLQKRESEFLQMIGFQQSQTKFVAYTALDDAMMMQFGGERLVKLMNNLGMAENEVISHKMVTSSILNAQTKLLKKVTYEQHAKSPEDWFRLNVQQ